MISKFKFVNTAHFRNGSLVNIKTGFTKVALAPGKKPDFHALHEAVDEGGFKLLKIHAQLEGELEMRDGQWQLHDRRHDARYQLMGLTTDNLTTGQSVHAQVTIRGPDIAAPTKGRTIPVTIKSVAAN